MSVRMSGGAVARLARRMRVFARLGKQLDRRAPRRGGVTPEFMRMVDRVVMGDPEELDGAAAPPQPEPAPPAHFAVTSCPVFNGSQPRLKPSSEP